VELEEKAEEILETLWIRTQEKEEGAISQDELAAPEDKRSLEQLLQGGYITLGGNGVRLTDEGRSEAANVVRRHRLAERLMVDVLNTGEALLDERACSLEHVLDRGLAENICTLLGHPKVCPHGRPIPPGRCCQEQQMEAQRLVLPLTQLAPGQQGKIAYVHALDPSQLHKLVATGIQPGAAITLIQRFPSYVFQIGQTQFAVDQEIAGAIHVRLVNWEGPGGAGQEAGGGQWRRRWDRMRRFGWPWRRG